MLQLVTYEPSPANSPSATPASMPLKRPPWACSLSLRLAQKSQRLILINPGAMLLVERLVDALLQESCGEPPAR